MVTIGDDPLLGVIVEGRYKIESVIGQGSAGTVYKAIQELIGRSVAIKVLHDHLVSDEEFIKRFRQEAKASSRLNHPNIITIYDFGVIPQGGRPYIAMDLLKGTPLSDLISEQNHLELAVALPIFKQVCDALGEAHRQGVVHRDIKPENIVLVERSGQKYFPIVVDFGIARLVEESDAAKITRTGTVCGSPTYMSPEQCTSSKVDQRSDIYSLAIVLYETLTGMVPFVSEELVKVMAMHLSDPPKPLNQVREDLHFPSALEAVINKALSKNPDDRYQSMEEFSQALAAAESEPVAKVVAIPHPKRPDITPGPLASDEELHPRRASKEKEVSGPQKPMDLATLALEELKKADASGDMHKGASAAKIVDIARIAKQQAELQSIHAAAISRANFQRGREDSKTAIGRLFDINPKVIVASLGILLALAAIAFISFSDAASMFTPWGQSNTAEADKLVKEGKLEEAFIIYKTIMEQTKLTKKQVETFDKILIDLSKEYAKDKRYDEALALLEQVTPKSAQAETARTLINTISPLLRNNGAGIKPQ